MAIDRLNPLLRELELIVAETTSPAAQAQYLRDFARQELAKAQAQNKQAIGYVPDHDTYVDGTQVADVNGAGPTSVILYEFHLLIEVLEWIDSILQMQSPVLTGRYQRSHQWFADGEAFDITAGVPPAREYVVLNTQPYARKIEDGLSSQAPQGVYEVVAGMARRRFGNVAAIQFGFRSLPHGAIGAWAQTAGARELARTVRGGRPALYEEWLTQQPAILIDQGR
jgi:hypothetical protein